MKKYSNDFGEALKEIACDDNADPVDVYYYLTQLADIGIAINEGEFTEDQVNSVFEYCDIDKSIIDIMLDKFLFHMQNELEK